MWSTELTVQVDPGVLVPVVKTWRRLAKHLFGFVCCFRKMGNEVDCNTNDDTNILVFHALLQTARCKTLHFPEMNYICHILASL